MILEHVILPVAVDRSAEFEAAFDRAKRIIAASPGFRRLTLSRGVENPASYLMVVEWDSLEAHTEGFRGSDAYQEWRALLHHFYDPFPVVEHFRPVTGA